jgi:predicted amidohydrolase
VQTRALENHVYYAAVNRIGEERGFRFIGQSRIVDYNSDLLAAAEGDEATILYAEIDPEKARNKRIVNIPGEYEVDRVADRRPEMYPGLCN